MQPLPLEQSLAALSRFLVGDSTVEESLRQVCDLTIEALPTADLVGITMMVEGRERTAVFTEGAAPEIDQAQYDAGEGPCLDAFRQHQAFVIDSTREDGPWPKFRQAAAGYGIGSTMSLPMLVGERAVGAMNLYSYAEHSFGDNEVAYGHPFASHAAVVLANAQTYWDARTLSERLGEAMKSRAVIEQAKGILMARQRCNEDDAFELLVRASQRENVKLRDVARRIVAAASEP